MPKASATCSSGPGSGLRVGSVSPPITSAKWCAMPACSRCGCTKREALLVTTASGKPIAAQRGRAPRPSPERAACRGRGSPRSAPGSAASASSRVGVVDRLRRHAARERERAPHQVGHPLADQRADRVLRQRRVPQLREQRVDRRREVVDGVEQRAVEVEARSRDVGDAAVGAQDRLRAAASSARMRGDGRDVVRGAEDRRAGDEGVGAGAGDRARCCRPSRRRRPRAGSARPCAARRVDARARRGELGRAPRGMNDCPPNPGSPT